MADIIELKTAKYKGVQFLFTDMTTVGGNRIIKYNYPGSDAQAVERQGKLPRGYALTIWVQHENYYQTRDNILRVLEDGITGTLTHPTFGDVDNVINGDYTLEEKITELGRASIKVTFEQNTATGVPRQSGNLAAQVQTRSQALNAGLSADFASKYKVSTGLTGNFSDALDTAANAVRAVERASQVVTPLTEGLSQFRAKIRRVTGAIGDLIQAPARLAAEIDGLFADLNNLFEAPKDAVAAFKALFDYGNDDATITPNTVARTERKLNSDLLRTKIQMQALSYAYSNASQATYTTTDELDEVQDILEVQYANNHAARLLAGGESETGGSLFIASNETLEVLDQVRVQAQAVLDEVRVSTRTTLTIETPRMPLSVLVYNYYGSTELVDTIADLNNIKQNAFVEGELRILTS